ncbi:MAG: hypothetical protein RLZZ408_847 [Verrucomicrobiota bacterium]
MLAALLATAWLFSGIATPRCLLHATTGIPCPTCGMTRTTWYLLHGEIGPAFLLNPLMTTALLGAALYVCYAAVVVIGRLPRLRLEAFTKTETNFVRFTAIGLLAANWIYLLLMC